MVKEGCLTTPKSRTKLGKKGSQKNLKCFRPRAAIQCSVGQDLSGRQVISHAEGGTWGGSTQKKPSAAVTLEKISRKRKRKRRKRLKNPTIMFNITLKQGMRVQLGQSLGQGKQSLRGQVRKTSVPGKRNAEQPAEKNGKKKTWGCAPHSGKSGGALGGGRSTDKDEKAQKIRRGMNGGGLLPEKPKPR